MSSVSEQQSILREFCNNTGASEQLARDVLTRNKWHLPSSYREAEQMCISYNRNTQAPPSQSHIMGRGAPPAYSAVYSQGQQPYGTVSGGGMVGGVGPAIVFDSPSKRPPSPIAAVTPSTLSRGQGVGEELRVALPPMRVPVERVIPIQVEGGRTVYGPQSTASGNLGVGGSSEPVRSAIQAMARVTLDDKVVPSKPQMVPSAGSGVDPPQLQQPVKQPLPPSSTATSNTTALAVPRLKRGFSNILENESLVSEARSSVLQDIEEDSHHHMYIQSFVLPDLTQHPEDFRAFLEKELIETSTLISLEQAGRLNWWAEMGLCQRLMPLATTGDGNCLLHAASLAMWGIHDRQLILRKALYAQLTDSPIKDNLYRRWRWQQTNVNKQSGLVFSEAEWKAEWDNILRLSSSCPRGLADTSLSHSNSCCDSPVTNSAISSTSDPVVYESLEEFHVFVLAHVLQRPIIVVADTVLKDANGEDLAPIPFGGIYLPLECRPLECCSSPLLLTYDAAHFSALVPMKQVDQDASLPLAIPVVDPDLKILPLHFCHDPGAKFDWSSPSNKHPTEPSLEDKLNLIKGHMDVMQLALPLSQNYQSEMPFVISTGPPSRQSSSGSAGSDEISTTLAQNAGTLKDKKKDGKVNPVAKQFGSLGKSMGKKLKNIGNNLAPNKGSNKGETEKGRPSLSGGLTQSTKVITALATTGNGEGVSTVWCARLTCHHTEKQDEMITNYLHDAHKRFIKDRELKRQKGEELRSRVALYPAAAAASRNRICASTGCNYYAGPDHELCSNCVRDRQRAWYYQQPQSKGQFVYNTFPGRHKVPSSSTGPSADEIYRYGKSKFYTPTAEVPPDPSAYRGLQAPSNMDRQQSLSTGNMATSGRPPPVPRPRSPSPDYDNVEYARQQGKDGKPVGDSNPKCRMSGCDFYGSKEMDYLCSGCYKRNRSQQAHLAKPEKTTKL